MKSIDLVAGARPNFMKIAPLIKTLQSSDSRGKISFRLLHTGQHYDPELSGVFFEQLGIPEPAINLKVGSGSHAEQTGAIMHAYEKIISESPPDMCVVVGDVNSTLACAIAAKKQCVSLAHIEAGIRSGDRTMPEEINRIVTDSISDWFFTTSEDAGDNLLKEGVDPNKVFFVGNLMIDNLLINRARLRRPHFWGKYGLKPQRYLVLTLHRPATVDCLDSFKAIIGAVSSNSGGLPVVFPVHPRTAKTLMKIDKNFSNVIFVDPQPYLEFNYLVSNSIGVITDSGGISEEATVMNIPCMTMRDSTERPETISIGTNELLGTDATRIPEAMERLLNHQWKHGAIPEKWDGMAASRIISAFETILCS